MVKLTLDYTPNNHDKMGKRVYDGLKNIHDGAHHVETRNHLGRYKKNQYRD